MTGKWRGILRVWSCAALIGMSGQANAAFHLWQITEVYSNASGTVQFIELTTLSGGQQFLANQTIKSSQGGTTNTFTFPNNLPADTTGKKMLLGTAGFRALNVVAPDFNVDLPDGFVFTSNGSLLFAGGADVFPAYATLPTDGLLSLNRTGALTTATANNSPTNFAGNTGSIVPANTPPSAPTNVITSTLAIGELRVAFSPPANNGGSAITTYQATCGVQTVTGVVTPILVSGLPTGVPIACTVIASNAVGTGPPSAPSASVAPLGLPFAPNIGIAVPGNAQVTISFTPPTNTGGSLLTGFTATCGSITSSGNNSPLTVTGLTNGVGVSCTVIASNAQGSGPASMTSNTVTPLAPATIPDAPTIGLAVAGNAQVTVNFSPPGNDGGAAITSYTATCSGVSASGAGSPITVMGLPNGVAVTCKVLATNSQGNSLPTVASNSVTPVTVPGAPTIGVAVAGNTQVTVNFAAPTNNGGSMITGYTATCGAQIAFGGFPPITVGGLTNGVAVTCRVFATNAQGNGALSAISNSVTPATIPGAPIIGLAVPGNASASIAFTAPAANGGASILSYMVSCTSGGNTISVTGTASPLYVLGMTNGSAYTCNVKASNALGAGPASSDVLITPGSTSLLASVVSRKLHNGVARDLPIAFSLPPGAPPTVEPRLIGNGHRMVFQSILGPASLPGGVVLTPNVGTVSASVDANELIVILTGIADNQRITLTLTNYEGTGNDESVTIGFLAGDVTGSGSVNAGDISATKARIGQLVGANNFKFDLNLTGDIGQADVSIVKARAGKTLP